ncbi:hypothetical protein O181_056962 [Austropuccinia psidii MF-1]|uniref:Uncharacterized protein n=1 Tax=Austropuccinia psidii MF-1 TaxID=1389203 RepID=A0A9Q3EGU2_9BASI|nr:hypothetical protein [Austropuccinia psidii MF-1]
MCKTKCARGKGYTAGASCITSVLMNDVEDKVNLDTGEFCTFIGAIKGHEVDITRNIDRPYPPVLRRPAYPASLRARGARIFGTKLSFSTAYHYQTDVLAERTIQTLENIIRRFCACGLEFKDSDCFTMTGAL